MSKECLFKAYLATCKEDRDANYSKISQQGMISVGEEICCMIDMNDFYSRRYVASNIDRKDTG